MKKKRLVWVIVLFITLFIGGGVNARMVSIDEFIKISDQVIDEMNALNSEYVMSQKLNKENKTIEIYDKKELMGIIDYTDEYISYVESAHKIESNVTRIDRNITIYTNVLLWPYMTTIMRLVDAKDYQFKDSVFELDDYDKYGLSIIFNNNIKNGTNSMVDDSVLLESFKISLDTDKMQQLKKDYTEPLNAENDSAIDSIFSNVTPHITNLKVKENRISFDILLNPSSNKDLHCNVLRAIEGGDQRLEIVNEKPIPCSKKTTFYEDNIQPNKTYYYKVNIIENNKNSALKKITNVVSEDTKEKEEIKNPETGVNNNNMFIGIMIITSISVILISKNTLFKRL